MRIRDRFGLWVQRMREWDMVSKEAWSDELWSAYAQRIFGTLVTERGRLNAPEPSVRSGDRRFAMLVEDLDFPVVERLDQLYAEGRVGAACQFALKDAMRIRATMDQPMLSDVEFFKPNFFGGSNLTYW